MKTLSAKTRKLIESMYKILIFMNKTLNMANAKSMIISMLVDLATIDVGTESSNSKSHNFLLLVSQTVNMHRRNNYFIPITAKTIFHTYILIICQCIN